MSKMQKPIDIVGKYYFNGKSISEFILLSKTENLYTVFEMN